MLEVNMFRSVTELNFSNLPDDEDELMDAFAEADSAHVDQMLRAKSNELKANLEKSKQLLKQSESDLVKYRKEWSSTSQIDNQKPTTMPNRVIAFTK